MLLKAQMKSATESSLQNREIRHRELKVVDLEKLHSENICALLFICGTLWMD